VQNSANDISVISEIAACKLSRLGALSQACVPEVRLRQKSPWLFGCLAPTLLRPNETKCGC
jgi:hypothetical protein